MYVPQSSACTMPNGTIPPDPATVAAAQAALASTESSIQSAQQVFSALLQRKDMGPIPKTIDPANLQSLKQWPMLPGRVKATGQPVKCNPASVEMNSLTTMPDAPPMPPLTTTRMLGLNPPTTGNPCLDVEMGYALQSQLSAAMLWKCTQNGYFKPGVKPTVPPVLRLANQNKLKPLPDQDVPPFDPSMLGMGDVAPAQNFILWASLGLGAAVLWLGREWSKGHR